MYVYSCADTMPRPFRGYISGNSLFSNLDPPLQTRLRYIFNGEHVADSAVIP